MLKLMTGFVLGVLTVVFLLATHVMNQANEGNPLARALVVATRYKLKQYGVM
ncbi:hypothetical protein [Serratia phage SMP]|uniref:Uncharacterized protein n=1 Tax=Serratia phage SMP TaxID=2982904 RepID=A0A9E8JZX0_9CAUD|nr:hypothetical protein [Serratia phage SMP]